jgi:hypothetical protein
MLVDFPSVDKCTGGKERKGAIKIPIEVREGWRRA